MSQLSAEKVHESIQPFQNWIDRIEISSSQGNRPRRIQSKSFTNGPYAEIKELIGKFQPVLNVLKNNTGLV